MRRSVHWATVCIASVLACAAVLEYFYGPQVEAWYRMREMVRDDPRLAIVPEPLQNTTVNRAPGTSISRFGYTFEVPWAEVARTRDEKPIAAITFKTGAALVLFDRGDWVTAMKSRDAARVRAAFGLQTAASNFALRSAILSATPDHASLSLPTKKAVRTYMLLLLKSTEVDRFASGLYSVGTADVRGFQEGDPSRGKTTYLVLFDEHGHEIELWIAADKEGKDKITQADVNRIIQTLHPTAESK